jgi:hypothetical protein
MRRLVEGNLEAALSLWPVSFADTDRGLVTTFAQRIGTRETVVRSRERRAGAPRRRIGAAPRHAPPKA